jgi:hypothetical protein
MRLSILLAALLLAGCNDTNAGWRVLSYEELVAYPTRCDKATEQLDDLKAIQRAKNFDPDPDKLDEFDRAYNSRLKATIWWYAYRRNKS